MMCLWNTANGPSIHAELIGRAWVKLGHQLKVFSALKHPDARPTFQKDEDFVIRHFVVDEVIPFTRATSFDPSPLLKGEYEVFVAQNVERLPAEKLLSLFPQIKKKAATVMVVHEGKAPDDQLYYKFDWDAIVCFDHRYRQYLVQSFPPEKIHLIPYPCHPFQPGNQAEARKKLNFPLDKKIIFSFGFRAKDCLSVLPSLRDLTKKYPLWYVIIANPRTELEILKSAAREYDFVHLEVKAIPLGELYTYLHASDVHLIHRESSRKYFAVVSSGVCQTLGSGCPILFHDSNFVELHGEEIIKYRDFDEMKAQLNNSFQHKSNIEKVKDYLREHSATAISQRFLELFEGLIKGRKGKGQR